MNSKNRRPSCLDKVVFLGGNPNRASVRIRCVQVAEAMGCEYIINVNNLNKIPYDKSVFVCVKPDLSDVQLQMLANRGVVIWDIQDYSPPHTNVAVYLGSSACAINQFQHLGKTYIIPQHHCNFSGIPNPPNRPRQPTWIGRPYWCPDFHDLDVRILNSNVMCLEEVLAAYRSMGLCLNVRRQCEDAQAHILLNDGGKLLNSMAFGVPSVSDNEPAYLEYGANCTVFCEKDPLKEYICRLQSDSQLYLGLREKGIECSRKFHLRCIVSLYIEFFSKVGI